MHEESALPRAMPVLDRKIDQGHLYQHEGDARDPQNDHEHRVHLRAEGGDVLRKPMPHTSSGSVLRVLRDVRVWIEWLAQWNSRLRGRWTEREVSRLCLLRRYRNLRRLGAQLLVPRFDRVRARRQALDRE